MSGSRAVGPLFKTAIEGITNMLRKVPRKKRNETLLNIAATKFRKASLQKSLRMKGGLRKWKSQIGNSKKQLQMKLKGAFLRKKLLYIKAGHRLTGKRLFKKYPKVGIKW